MSHSLKSICVTAIVAIGATLAYAEKKPSPARVLDTSSKGVQKLEVRHSQIGYRNTLIFYTFSEQRAVLKVSIGNKDKTFPVTGTVYIFPAKTTADGLKKWLNNQHSDGLFPEVPKPAGTYQIPPKSCSTVSHKFIDHTKHFFGEYDNYTVKFRISDVTEKGIFKLNTFTSQTKVHVKTKDSPRRPKRPVARARTRIHSLDGAS
ncbi:MAG: hypothetical protein OER86_05770 [Phycisphaerae bacterium]|nr:hypothetical protein [Phycisphaerae bacterium]